MGTDVKIYTERRGEDGDMELIDVPLTSVMENEFFYATYAMLSNVRNTFNIFTPFVTNPMVERSIDEQNQKEIDLGIGQGYPSYSDYYSYRYIKYDISEELSTRISHMDDYSLNGYILLDDLIKFDYSQELLFDGATEEEIEGFDESYGGDGLFTKWIDVVPEKYIDWLNQLKDEKVTHVYFTYA